MFLLTSCADTSGEGGGLSIAEAFFRSNVLRFVLSAMLYLRKLFADGTQTSSCCEMVTDLLELEDVFILVCMLFAKLVCVAFLVVALAPL